MIDNILPKNNHLKYLNHAWYTTGVFFVIGIISSWLGLTTIHIDLSFISENKFIATITFLGFIVSINERIMEVVVKTFRRRTRIAYELEIEGANILSNEKHWKMLLQNYRAETGRYTLWLSLIIGCSLASLGFFRVFGLLIEGEWVVSPLHVLLIDAIDVVITGWIISGGTEGWSKLTSSLRDVMAVRKDFVSNK